MSTPDQNQKAQLKIDLDKAYSLLRRVIPKVKDIEAAGRYLADRRKLYPLFLEELCARHRELSMYTLSYYADVGDGLLFAPYVLYGSDCAAMIEKIKHMPLDQQKHVFEVGIEVLVGNESMNMKFYDVTEKIYRQIWDGFHLRTLEEQRHFIERKIKPRLKPSKSRYSVDSKAKCVRIGNVTLFREDVIVIAKEILDVDDLMGIIREINAFVPRRKKAA